MMAAIAKELEYQTMTSVGKVSVTDDSTAILPGLIGFSATKLWNTAVWHTKKTWETTGKIPTYSDLGEAMKQEHPLWYRRLHSQSAQAVLCLFGVVAVWHSLQSTGSPGEIPGHLHQPMNRRSGKHLCRICEQNLHWLSVVVEPGS